jgi:hypothetical protein
MAEEKPRASRARKKTVEPEAGATARAPAAKRKPTATRSRRKTSVAVEPADVATLAYLLWERGEPGDATEHWLRAEQELAAA